MASDLTTVLASGAIGLVSALIGATVGHWLTNRRDARARTVDGLRLVVSEINRLCRIALYFEQQINLGLRDATPSKFALSVHEREGWTAATHEVQETHWRFPCMAYLPDARGDFATMQQQLMIIMDPHTPTSAESSQPSRQHAWSAFRAAHSSVQAKVEAKLAKL